MRNLLKMSLLAIIITGTMACEKEEKNQANSAASAADKIEGEWQMTYFLDTLGSVNSQGQDPAFTVKEGQVYHGKFTFGSNSQIASSTNINYRGINDVRTLPPDTVYGQETDYLNGSAWSATDPDTVNITMPNNAALPFYITKLDDNHLEVIWEREWSSAGYDMTQQLVMKFER